MSKINISLPADLVISADDGGVGKTTLVVQLATAFKLAGLPFALFQLDSKGKLSAKTALPVTSMSVDAVSARNEDINPADVIAPWYRAVTVTGDRPSTILEIGAANAPLFHRAASELDIQEDIEALDLNVIAIVVCRAGEDSAKQTLREVKRLEANMPGAHVIFARNEMHGCALAAADYLDDEIKKPFLALFKRHKSIVIPRVRQRSMAIYERLHVTPDIVVGWHIDNYAEAIRRTGQPRDQAKMVVKDIAAWSGVVQSELARILPFLTGGDDA